MDSSPTTAGKLRKFLDDYVWKPLHLGQTPPDEIRVLQLLPPTNADDLESIIECKILHVDLNSDPKYDALSYCWGPRDTSHRIIVDGKAVPVSEHLYQGLLHLRSKSPAPQNLWIDAICIDQSNIPERNQQVSKMKRIYTHSDTLRIWLGASSENSSLAFAFVARLLPLLDPKEVENALRDPRFDDQLAAFRDLLQRVYWQRIWVVQEVCLPEDAMIHCGADQMPFSDLADVQNKLAEDHYDLVAYIAHDRPGLLHLDDFLVFGGPRFLVERNHLDEHKESDLHQLLVKHLGKRATDPRDKIYGLLGLVRARSDPLLRVDYGRTKREIYIDAVRHVIADTKRLDILNITNRADLEMSDLPSWVPDFDTKVVDLRGPFDHTKYHASSLEPTDWSKACVRFSEDAATLRTNGRIVSRIAKVAPTLAFRDKDDTRAAASTICVWIALALEMNLTVGWNFLSRTFATVHTCGLYAYWYDSVQRMRNLTGALRDVCEREDPAALSPRIRSYLAEYLDHDWDREAGAVELLYMGRSMFERSFVICENGMPGLGPESMREGDVVCALHGCALPIVMRAVGEHYVYVGAAYVDGVMSGEAFDPAKSGNLEDVEFEIK